MIAPDAEPIDHRSPYKRVDLAARRPRPPADDVPVDPAPAPVWVPIEDLYSAP